MAKFKGTILTCRECGKEFKVPPVGVKQQNIVLRNVQMFIGKIPQELSESRKSVYDVVRNSMIIHVMSKEENFARMNVQIKNLKDDMAARVIRIFMLVLCGGNFGKKFWIETGIVARIAGNAADRCTFIILKLGETVARTRRIISLPYVILAIGKYTQFAHPNRTAI